MGKDSRYAEMLAEWAECGDGFDEGRMLKRLITEIEGLERFRDLRTRHNDEMQLRTSQLAKVEAERDELKAENADLSVRVAELYKENERLVMRIHDFENPDGTVEYLNEVARLEQELGCAVVENERLRAALNQTLDCDHDFQTCKCDDLLALGKEPTDE